MVAFGAVPLLLAAVMKALIALYNIVTPYAAVFSALGDAKPSASAVRLIRCDGLALLQTSLLLATVALSGADKRVLGAANAALSAGQVLASVLLLAGKASANKGVGRVKTKNWLVAADTLVSLGLGAAAAHAAVVLLA